MATSFELPPPFPQSDPTQGHPHAQQSQHQDHSRSLSRKRKVEFLFSGNHGSDASSSGEDKPSTSKTRKGVKARNDGGDDGSNQLRKRARSFAPGSNQPNALGGSKDEYYKRWLYRYMQVLDHSQLVSILCKLPTEVLSGLLEKPTVGNVEKYLTHLEKKLQEAFPYNKNGRRDDDYSFNRVRPMLTDIQETLLEFANYFESFGDIYTTTTYLAFSTSLAFRLPNFTTLRNAALKHDLIMRLSGFWQRGITQAVARTNQEGRMWGENVVREWHRALCEFEALGKEMLASREDNGDSSQRQQYVLQEKSQSMEHSPSPGASPRRRSHSQMSTSPVPSSFHHQQMQAGAAGDGVGGGELLFENARTLLERELGWMLPFQDRKMIMPNG